LFGETFAHLVDALRLYHPTFNAILSRHVPPVGRISLRIHQQYTSTITLFGETFAHLVDALRLYHPTFNARSSRHVPPVGWISLRIHQQHKSTITVLAENLRIWWMRYAYTTLHLMRDHLATCDPTVNAKFGPHV